MHKKIIFLVAAALVMCLFALAQGEEKNEMAELLFVQNSHDVSLEKGRLTLKRLARQQFFSPIARSELLAT